MEALLAGDFDEDDDDDDESFDEGKEEEEDDDDEEETAVGAVETSGRWPLHALACGGKTESLAAALAEGASTGRITTGTLPDGTPRAIPFDPNQTNVHNEPPLHATILAAAELLALAAAPPDDPWVRANAKDATRLLTPAASPLATDGAKPAPIDEAAEAQLTCIGLLLKAGADPERKLYGRSALHLACACAALPALGIFSKRVIELLLGHGASVIQVDACGKTPLHYAAVGFDSAAVDLLLSNAAGMDASAMADKTGATALHDALRAGAACTACVHSLVAKGAPAAVRAADVEGMTPMHLACAAGLSSEATLLVSKGADAQAKDAIGRPAAALSPSSGDGHASYPMLLLAHPASLLHSMRQARLLP